MKKRFEKCRQVLMQSEKRHKEIHSPILLMLFLTAVICQGIYKVKTLMRPAMRRRITASALAFCMMFTLLPATTFAAEPQKAMSICEHHTEHTPECGYSEGLPGTPCSHEYKVNGGEADGEGVQGHTEDCYKEVTDCTHKHTTGCYPEDDSVSDNAATPPVPEKEEPTECTHICSEETGCITRVEACPHRNGTHDDTCGYAAGTKGTACGFVCEVCEQTSEQEPEQTPEQAEEQTEAVKAVLALINALPTIDEVGAVDTEGEGFAKYLDTLKADVLAARVAYDALTEEEKTEIDAVTLEKLTGLEEVLAAMPVVMAAVDRPLTADVTTLVNGGTYTVNGEEQLEKLATLVNSGQTGSGATITLQSDITLTSEWTPIGNDSKAFCGTFDGDNHIIYGLKINTDTRYCGLFGKMNGATIKNLGIENANIISTVNDVAALVGNAQGGSIEGCYVTGAVKGCSAVSGILGSTHSSSYPTLVSNCYARVELAKTGTTKDVAGISGWNESTSVEITNSYSACIGEIRPIAGWSDGNPVKNSQFVNTYFDETLSPDFSEGSGRTDLGKSSDDLKKEETFTGWDFSDVWAIDSTRNGGYPYLKNIIPGLGGSPGSITVVLKDTGGNAVTDSKVALDISNSATTPSVTLNEESDGVYSGTVTTNNATYYVYVNDEYTGSTIEQTDNGAVQKEIAVTAPPAGGCTCVVSVPTFTDSSVQILADQANTTYGLQASGSVLSGGCTAAEHSSTTITYSYAEKIDAGNIASVSGSTLTVTGAGEVVVTATASANGKTAATDATFTVTKEEAPPPVNAATPVIENDLSDEVVTYTQNATAEELSVTATVSDGGTLSYQWYSNDTADNMTPTIPTTTTASTYTPPTNVVGTTYYYCLVTNTNNNASGTKTASVISAIAKVKVTAPAAITIFGTVNKADATPLASGTIYLYNGETGAVTARGTTLLNGTYSFTNVPAGSYFLLVNVLDGIGHKAITAEGAAITDADITLQPKTSTLPKENDLFRVYSGGDKTYDIHGKDGTNEIMTTYNDNGYATYLSTKENPLTSSDASIIMVNGVPNLAANNRIKVSSNFAFISGGKYLQVTYTLENLTKLAIPKVSLGVCTDVKIGDNDYASIYRTPTGFRMANENTSDAGAGKQFSLACKDAAGATSVDTLWFGSYGSRTNNLFQDTTIDELKGEDSGLAFSWKNRTLAPESKLELSVLFSVNEIAAPPVLPDGDKPFKVYLSATGEKEIIVAAEVQDTAGLKDMLYYRVNGGGEQILSTATATGQPINLVGTIPASTFAAPGVYNVEIWIMNTKGAMSEAVTKVITVAADGGISVEGGFEQGPPPTQGPDVPTDGNVLTNPLTQEKVDNAFGPGNATLDTTTTPNTIIINNDIIVKVPIEIEASPVKIDLGGNTITGENGSTAGGGKTPIIVGDNVTVDIGGSGSITGGSGGPGGDGADGITGGTDSNITIGKDVIVSGGAGGSSGGAGGDGVNSMGDVTIDGSVDGGSGSGGASGESGGDGVDTSTGTGDIVISNGGSATGGDGGNAAAGTGGSGGNGTNSGSGSTTVDSGATGGTGGSGTTGGGAGGSGSISTGGGIIIVDGETTGGTGGNASSGTGGAGGNGSGTGGSTDINNGGTTTGGAGGNGSAAGGNGGSGTGSGTVTVDNGGTATGGNGGSASSGIGGSGGNGTTSTGNAGIDGTVTGGTGGSGTATGGNGGNGAASGTGSGIGDITVGGNGDATGGNGGSATGGNGTGGNGGNGTSTGGKTEVETGGSSTGGSGGTGGTGAGGSGGNGGNGGNGTNSGSTTVNGGTTGGDGGNGNGNGNGGDGGNGANQGSGTVNGSGSAAGGNGGNGTGTGNGGLGGAAVGGGAAAGGSLDVKPGINGRKATAEVDDSQSGTTVTVPDKSTLANAALTEEEKKDPTITEVNVVLNVEKKKDQPDKDKIDMVLKQPSVKADTIGAFFDITLDKVITNASGVQPSVKVKDASEEIEITITLPADMRGGSNYVVIRVHNGIGAALTTTRSDDKLTFKTDKFSTYAIAYTKAGGGTDPNPPTGGDGGGSGGGSSKPPVTVTPSDKPNTPTTVETEIQAAVDENGNGAVTLSGDTVEAAIKKAVDEAEKAGKAGNGIAVVIHVSTGGKNASSMSVNLPRATQEYIISNQVSQFTLAVENPAIVMGLNLAAITEINRQANGDVQLTAKKAIGTRPVFALTAAFQNGTKVIDDVGSGKLLVAIPYTLSQEENPGSLYAVYTDETGKVNYLTESSYDANSKAVIFAASHFRTYAVGYKATALADISGHWAKDDIEFAANRGLFIGTDTNIFNPDTAVTRAMFVTALGRLAGIDSTKYNYSNFTDVNSDAYYTPYVAWAVEKNIVSGTTATTFAPDQAITRQEMAVMMQNYANATGYTIQKTREPVAFADNASITGRAAAAVKSMQMAGIVNGKDGNCFDPTGIATRAEVSAVLRRYVELVIDKATAQGLDVNDSGKIIFYENGRLFTGTKTIGGTTYHFGADGICTNTETVAITYRVVSGDTIWRLSREYKCTVAEIVELNGINDVNNVLIGTELTIPLK